MNRALLAVWALAAFLTASACSNPATPRSVPPEGTTSPDSGAAGPQPVSVLEFGLEPVARGFEQPLLVTHAGDGSERLFVVEQGGLVRVVRDGTVARSAFLDLRDEISTGGERGLLGLAFAPDFEESGHLYVDYTDTNGDTVIARYTADDPASDAPSFGKPRKLLTVEQPYANHNGGNIVFGPDDLLWVGMGDGGSAGDPGGNAQDAGSLLGKMLTLDVSKRSPRPRIVVSGLRNPWRFSFDRETGDLWIGDVGQNEWEEIDLLRAGRIEGANLGWNVWEGNHPYPSDASPARKGFTFPIAEHARDEARSITGGFVYRGRRYPRMEGVYLYADFEAGWVGALRTDEGTKTPTVAEQRIVLRDVGNPSSFGEDEDGELYLCDWAGGTVYAVTVR